MHFLWGEVRFIKKYKASTHERSGFFKYIQEFPTKIRFSEISIQKRIERVSIAYFMNIIQFPCKPTLKKKGLIEV